MNITEQTFVNEDKAGNKLLLKVFISDKNEKLNAKLSIKLVSEKYPRNMGTYDFRDKTFYCVRDSAKHYHRITKGYAINWTIFEDPVFEIDKIHMVIDDSEHYLFPASVVKDYGKFLNFKQQGFELQRFIPLEIIKRYKINDKPNLDDKPGDDNKTTD